MDLEIPAAWEVSVATIMQRRWRKVLIIGNVDCGKSTYCYFLSQRLLAAGWRIAVIDADIGQKDIGPPATITLGYPEPAVALASVQPVAWYFVGSVTPVGHLLPMIIGLKQLLDMAQGAFVLINTTGFINGVGRVLKGYKIEAVQPDVVIAIEQDAELQPLLQAYRHYRTLHLRPAARARIKTPEQRRLAREQAFLRYFQPATEVQLPCRRLIFQRTAIPAGLHQSLLCGVADRRGKGLGLALITDVDWPQGTLSLLTPVPAALIRILQGGNLSLTPDGYELDRR